MPDPKPPAEPTSIPYATPAPRRRLPPALVAVLVALALLAGVALLGLARRVTVTVNVAPATPTPATPTSRVTAAPQQQPPPPPVMDLPADPPRLTITQRRAEAVPGSAGTVLLQIGDITGGQVRLAVLASDGRTLAAKTVRPGGAVEFALAGKPYVVAATRFDLSLTGPDAGEFVVRRAADPPTGEERIGRLLDAAAKSGAVTVAAGAADEPAGGTGPATEQESKPLEEYLRDVWLFRKPRSTTPEALAGQAVRPADAATLPPRVRLRDGREMPLGEWLKAELAKLK